MTGACICEVPTWVSTDSRLLACRGSGSRGDGVGPRAVRHLAARWRSPSGHFEHAAAGLAGLKASGVVGAPRCSAAVKPPRQTLLERPLLVAEQVQALKRSERSD